MEGHQGAFGGGGGGPPPGPPSDFPPPPGGSPPGAQLSPEQQQHQQQYQENLARPHQVYQQYYYQVFLAQQAPVYLLGNWQVAQFDANAEFGWRTTANPTLSSGGGFPGGNFMVGFSAGPEN